jgi:hypothetical protein
MVTDKLDEVPLVLPALMLCAPFDSADVVMEYVPFAATPDPTVTPSLKIVTVLPSGATPVKVGVITLVMLSVLDVPESDAAARSGIDGTSVDAARIVTERLDEAKLTLPAASDAFAVMLCVATDSAEVVMV